MEIDEPLRATLKSYYQELFKSENALYGYPGSVAPSLIIGTIILPVVLVSNGVTSVLYLVCLVLWLLAIYESFKQLSVKQNLLAKINDIETVLSKNSDLLFCGCHKFDGHFFCPESEQLYNIKSEILFDKHPKKYYEIWRSGIRPESKKKYRLFKISTVIVVLLNILLLGVIYV